MSDAQEQGKKERKRTPRSYIVQELAGAGPGEAQDTWQDNLRNVPSTQAGVKSIKESGQAGKTYRVIRVTHPAVTLSVESVEKRTLTEAPR